MKKCSGFEVFAGSDRGFSRKLKFKKKLKENSPDYSVGISGASLA